MSLDLTSLRNILAQLSSSIQITQNHSSADRQLFVTLRFGVIHYFKMSFEICYKHMIRWLKMNKSISETEIITAKEVFRLSAQEKLIDNPVEWFRFQEARNINSHTYDEEKADKVYKIAVEFLPSAKQFLSNVERAND